MALTLTSPAFAPMGDIPVQYTCQGDDLSPPLEWTGVPEGTESLALVVDDPDAPDPAAPKLIWVHWILYNIPPDAGGLPEGLRRNILPQGAGEGLNDWKNPGYGGPCPPIGKHRYVFKLYALNTTLEDLGTPTRARLERAMIGYVIEQTELVGLYEKSAENG